MRNVSTVLAEAGVPGDVIESALNKSSGDTDSAWRTCVSSGYLTENDVFRSLAKISSLEFVDLKSVDKIENEVLDVLPHAFCREENLIPIAIKGDYLFIGTANPGNFQAIDEISASSNYAVIVKIVTPSALVDTMNRYFRTDDEIEKLSDELEQIRTEDEELDQDISTGGDDDSPIVKFVNLVIAQAIQDRASDIHVEPGEKGLKIRYRIDGVLHDVKKADRGIQNGIISRLKIMSEIDIAEKRKPQDGRLSVQHSGRKIDIRVTTLPIIWGEKVVMRILDTTSEKRSINYINMSENNEKIYRRAIERPSGMILVTGPTGSGKSTTLYTTLDEVTDSSLSVVTVEDPVEKRIEGVSQIQINKKAGNTFSSILARILRADPDIIFIGEIRDRETASIAIEASMTGHLVLTTLHTNGAPEAVSRLVNMGVEPYLVGTSVSCVVAQRLARKLCEECKTLQLVEDHLAAKIEYPYLSQPYYMANGCNNCSNTGFRGRVALTEIMEVTEAIENMILDHQSAPAIRKHAEESGLVSLRNDGWDKVRMGLTTIKEVLRVTA